MVLLLLLARPAIAIVSSDGGVNPPYSGININQLIGADTFYDLGYTGSRAVVSNIEGWHIWNGHETLGHVTTYIDDPGTPPPNGDFDQHPTFVAAILGGRPGGTNPGEWQRGIAYGAEIWSGSVATAPIGTPFTLNFNFTAASMQTPYYIAMVSGVGGRTTDVVNSSWGFNNPRDNRAAYGRVIDALANQMGTTVVVAAGNTADTTDPRVLAPGNNFNNITAAALTSDLTSAPYETRASFSNYGPNDFWNPQTLTVVPGVVATVDLAAPATNLTAAFYGGATGGNAGGVPTPGSDLYLANRQGTSFAAPIIAGGAALIVDVGKARFGGGPAIDGRVVKSVLQNSATKTPGWDNGQQSVGGVLTTTQSLDYFVGAGRLNLRQAYAQYTAGTTDLPGLGGGVIHAIGWDFGQVVQGSPTDYAFDVPLEANTLLTGTLNWFIDNTYSFSALNASDGSLDNLDLEVWKMSGGAPDTLIARSASTYNNVEHLSFLLPETGHYLIRVNWTGEIFDRVGDANQEVFGLAWSAVELPEPASVPALVVMFTLIARRRRRNPQAHEPRVGDRALVFQGNQLQPKRRLQRQQRRRTQNVRSSVIYARGRVTMSRSSRVAAHLPHEITQQIAVGRRCSLVDPRGARRGCRESDGWNVGDVARRLRDVPARRGWGGRADRAAGECTRRRQNCGARSCCGRCGRFRCSARDPYRRARRHEASACRAGPSGPAADWSLGGISSFHHRRRTHHCWLRPPRARVRRV